MPQVSASWLQALFLDLAMVPGFVRQQPDLSEALDRAPTRVLVACVPKSGDVTDSSWRTQKPEPHLSNNFWRRRKHWRQLKYPSDLLWRT